MKDKNYEMITDKELQNIEGGKNLSLSQGLKQVYDSIWPNNTAWNTGQNSKSSIPQYNPYGLYK